jgi:hypothetical protein
MTDQSQADPNDFTDRYNTTLPAQDEQRFQAWMQDQSKSVGRNVPNDLYDYDLRGWWQNHQDAQLNNAHLADTYKKPNHPTFSDQSQYHGVDGFQGGQWQKQGTAWKFHASKSNLKMFSGDELKDYFSKVEPGNSVVLPESVSQ